MSGIELTPDQWCFLRGVQVLDPDGWRGSGGRPWSDCITESEFRERLRVCTVDMRASRYLDGSDE